ncbi:MAG: carboxypeptidase regulatory-like domain-containing protein [Gemmatimonadaceae bacterium]|nr:carboxypeptidase regulatory-like domain-containing protein [Gemmatimonadaceae bacterium]
MHRVASSLLALSIALGSAGAQAASTTRVTVNGLAFDSLRGAPLANAFVMIEGRSRSTTSDAKGRFSFDTLPPGTYTFAMQHAVFDSLGLSGATTRAVVTDGKALVTLAVPSFATLWRAVCGGVPVPVSDSGLVYGNIRDAKQQRPVAQASVEVSWLDLVNLGTKQSSNVTQRRWKSEAQADAQGGYAVCGVPLQTQLRIRANYLMNRTGLIDLPPSSDRVRRRDLMLAGTALTDSLLRGAVGGVVTDADGKPVPGARVILDDVSEARTDADGRFTLRDAPTGSRQVDVAAIGMSPISSVVDIAAGDTAFFAATLRTITHLEALNITASTTRRRAAVLFDERRKLGLGSFLDSSTIGRRGTLGAAFAAVKGVTVQTMSGNGRRFNIYLPSTGLDPCLAMLLLDGAQQFDHEILGTLSPADIAAIEVYPQRLTVPVELMNKEIRCGVVAVWTKRAFR